jgi:hypothetical protein
MNTVNAANFNGQKPTIDTNDAAMAVDRSLETGH